MITSVELTGLLWVREGAVRGLTALTVQLERPSGPVFDS